MSLFSFPPLVPPTSEGSKQSWLRLLRSRRVGVATFYRLMAKHDGDADAALAALPEIANAAGVVKYAPCPVEAIDLELEAGRRAGAQAIFFGDVNYPRGLMDVADAPPVLWAKGDLSHLNKPALAMVGARNASSLGRRMAKSLAEGLGNAGFTVASGLARGIDAAAHEASLETGTIAVVAGGVDIVYPRENAALTAKIAEAGVILSEMPPGLQPQARHFPRRNRIISGIAQAVIVVEAASRSGSLITARDALDQGRDVLAVPGHPFDARASGCNMLIRDGATLVRGTKDVLEALPSTPDGKLPDVSHRSNVTHISRQKREAAVSHPDSCRIETGDPVRDRILALLGPTPLAEDQLMRDLAIPGQQIADELLDLEMEGRVTRQPGGLLALAV